MMTTEALAQAAREANRALVAAAEALEEGEHRQPDPAWERRLLAREKHRSLRRVAAAVLAVALGLTGWLTADVQARQDLTGWVLEVYDRIIVYRPRENRGENIRYVLGYLPKGYVYFRRTELDNGVSLLYRNVAGEYLRFAYAWSGSLQILPEGDGLKHASVAVRGRQADLWYPEEPGIAASLLWTDDGGMIYSLSGPLESKELIKIAESVEIWD